LVPRQDNASAASALRVISDKIAAQAEDMDRFTANRLLYGSVLALCLMGGVALAGLVTPMMRGYLDGHRVAGDSIIHTTTPMVSIGFTPKRQHIFLLNGDSWAEVKPTPAPGRIVRSGRA